MVPGVSPPLLSLPHLLTQGGHPLTFYPSPSLSGTLSILPSVVLSPSPWCLKLLGPSLCHFFPLDSQGGFSSIRGKDFFSLLGSFSGPLCAKPFQGNSRRSLSRHHPTGILKSGIVIFPNGAMWVPLFFLWFVQIFDGQGWGTTMTLDTLMSPENENLNLLLEESYLQV